MTLQVKAFFHQDSSTLSYVVYDPQTLEAAIIDPVMDFDASSGELNYSFAQEQLAFIQANQLKPEWVLETHAHADHLTAAQYFQQELGCKIAIGRGIGKVQGTFKALFNIGDEVSADGAVFDHLFDEDDTFNIGRFQGKVINTPGHTNDSVTYVIDGNAFVGDSLFMPDAGTARCDFPGGDARELFASVQKLYALGDDTRIYVCHDYQPGGRELAYMATVAEHKAGNIHINAETDCDEFVEVRESRDKTLAVPKLIYPSLQVNIKAGRLPEAEDNQKHYLKIPLSGPAMSYMK